MSDGRRTIPADLLFRAVHALDFAVGYYREADEPGEAERAQGISREIRACLYESAADPTAAPIEGQTTIYDHLADSSPSQRATLPGDD